VFEVVLKWSSASSERVDGAVHARVVCHACVRRWLIQTFHGQKIDGQPSLGHPSMVAHPWHLTLVEESELAKQLYFF